MGKKKRSQMNNLEIALDNISAAFREGKKAGITVEKDNWRDDTYKTYESEVKTMFRELAKMIGENDKRILPKYTNAETWDRYFEHLAKKYEQGEITADTVQKRVHALEAFRHMVKYTNVLGKDTTIRVGDKEERLEYLKERGVCRSKDEVTSIKPTREVVEKVHSHIDRSTHNGNTAYLINKLQVETGGRIRAMLKLEVKDVNFEKNTITFRCDKNNFTRTIPLTEKARNILRPLCEGKKPGQKIFTIKNQKGKDKKLKEAVKTVERLTREAAKKAGVYEKNKRFTTHSNRKRYAQNLYEQTRSWSKSKLKREIRNYIQMQGSNEESIKQRIRNELYRINRYRKMKKKEIKGFSHEHLRRMYVALHLGHSRCDIVLRYIKPDPVRDIYGK
ncbi:site-specific integrase [Saccharococcus thermophilus]|uniref:Integrase n=1 Tax=Saccharococcus thermophilus TaxID=29396 RepID=A0A846MLP9_9BACL|nr:site-specific integrase [Saccharococcus thermophilus]NIK16589.1 integrase [Saccharococcus thermophilus]NIK16597.1 integrase [Saccharococcus thermophilus]